VRSLDVLIFTYFKGRVASDRWGFWVLLTVRTNTSYPGLPSGPGDLS
jgi:hypothetical protein